MIRISKNRAYIIFRYRAVGMEFSIYLNIIKSPEPQRHGNTGKIILVGTPKHKMAIWGLLKNENRI